MKLLIRWLLSAITLILLAYYMPGIAVISFYAALVAALVLGLINALIRPVVLFLTLPINVLTLGLLTLVINALMFWFASTIAKGFYVDNFWAAFSGALAMTIVGWVVNVFLTKDKTRI